MKKCIYSLIAFMMLGIIACNKEDSAYSCDPDVDKWVKNNLESIHKMNRVDWVKIDDVLKSGVYAAFTYEQKRDLWKGKLNELLSMDWNEKEKSHLEKMYKFIDDNPFLWRDVDLEDEVYDNFDRFQYEWLQYAYDVLGWNKSLIGNMLANPAPIIDRTGKLAKVENSVSTIKLMGDETNGFVVNRSLKNCNCSIDSDWCGEWRTCKNEPCMEGSYCGFLLLHNCDGVCIMKEGYIDPGEQG